MAYSIKVVWPDSVPSARAHIGFRTWIIEKNPKIYITLDGKYVQKRGGNFLTLEPKQLEYSITSSGDTATATATISNYNFTYSPYSATGQTKDDINVTLTATDTGTMNTSLYRIEKIVFENRLELDATGQKPDDMTSIFKYKTYPFYSDDGENITDIVYKSDFTVSKLYADSSLTTELDRYLQNSPGTGYAQFTIANPTYFETSSFILPIEYVIIPQSLTPIPISYTISLSRNAVGTSVLDYIELPEGYYSRLSENYILDGESNDIKKRYYFDVDYNPNKKFYETVVLSIEVNIKKTFTKSLDKQYGNNKVKMKYYNGTEWKEVSIKIY